MMHKIKMPLQSIVNKCKQDGIDPSEVAVFIAGDTSIMDGGSKKKKGGMSGILGALKGGGMKKKQNVIPKGMTEIVPDKPSQKMRNCHFIKIDGSKIQGTVWHELNAGIDTKFDQIEFESLFKAPQSRGKSKKDKSPMSPSPSTSKKRAMKVKEKVALIDAKRSYNIDIGLSRVRLSHAVIRDAILSMDESIFNAEKLSTFKNFVPTSSEIAQINAYDGDPKNLANTDHFFWELKSISDCPKRLDLWEFKLKLNEILKENEWTDTFIKSICTLISVSFLNMSLPCVY